MSDSYMNFSGQLPTLEITTIPYFCVISSI